MHGHTQVNDGIIVTIFVKCWIHVNNVVKWHYAIKDGHYRCQICKRDLHNRMQSWYRAYALSCKRNNVKHANEICIIDAVCDIRFLKQIDRERDVCAMNHTFAHDYVVYVKWGLLYCRKGTLQYVVVNRIIKIMKYGPTQVDVGIIVTIFLKCHIL